MAVEKEIPGKETIIPPLSVVRKKPVKKVKVIKMKRPVLPEGSASQEKEQLAPPLTRFNSAYFKGKDRDPL